MPSSDGCLRSESRTRFDFPPGELQPQYVVYCVYVYSTLTRSVRAFQVSTVCIIGDTVICAICRSLRLGVSDVNELNCCTSTGTI